MQQSCSANVAVQMMQCKYCSAIVAVQSLQCKCCSAIVAVQLLIVAMQLLQCTCCGELKTSSKSWSLHILGANCAMRQGEYNTKDPMSYKKDTKDLFILRWKLVPSQV